MDFAYLFLFVFLLPLCIGQDAASFSVEVLPKEGVLTFKLSEGKVLSCTSSSSDADLSWYYNRDTPITTTDLGARVRVEKSGQYLRLRFTKVEEQDAGMYTCKGVQGNLNDEKTITVEVMVPLQILSSKDQMGILGTEGNVECKVTGKPVPSLTWKFSNGSVIANSDKYIISPNVLTIKQLTLADNQTYICYIIVDATGDEMDFRIDYFIVQKPIVDLLPVFTPTNPKIGDTVEIRCTSKGIPKPEFTFFRGDIQISEDKVDKQNGILTLTNVQREDEAVYKCVATNRGGSDFKTNTLDVKIPPVIANIDDVMDASEGAQVKLKCTAEGDPEPSVTWKKDGTQTSFLDTGVRADDPYILTEDTNNLINAITKTQTKILIFDKVRPGDAGTYTCTAFNLVGSTNKTAKIAVKYKPHFNTDFQVKEFWGWTGHTANLTCQASANELASISWFTPDSTNPNDRMLDRPIESNPPYILTTIVTWPEYQLSSRSLLVSLTSADNEDLYKDYVCKASNVLGDAYNTVTLKKATPPGQPVVKITEALSTSARLQVEKPDDNGGVDVTSYKYKFTLNGQLMKEQDFNLEGDTTPLEVKNLVAGSKYNVEVAARNPVGLGSFKSIFVQTLDVSRPEKLTIESPSMGDASNSYLIQWSDPVDGGSPIQKFNIKFRKCEITEMTNDAKLWKVKKYLENQDTTLIVEGPNQRSFTLNGLDSDSYYDVRISAVNDKGESDPEMKIIKTSSQAGGARDEAAYLTVANIFLLLVMACLSALW